MAQYIIVDMLQLKGEMELLMVGWCVAASSDSSHFNASNGQRFNHVAEYLLVPVTCEENMPNAEQRM